MTIASDQNDAPAKARAPKWQRILIGAFFGAAVGFGGSELLLFAFPDRPDLPDLSVAQLSALTAATMSFAIGIICLIMSFSRRMYEMENANPESGPDEHAAIAPQLRIAAISMLAMGAEFVALCLPVEPARMPLVIGVIAAALLVQGWANWRAWQDGDELYRAVVLEGSAISLGLVLVILTIWVPLAMYGVLSFDPLALVLVVTLVAIVPTIWLTVKRGMTE